MIPYFLSGLGLKKYDTWEGLKKSSRENEIDIMLHQTRILLL